MGEIRDPSAVDRRRRAIGSLVVLAALGGVVAAGVRVTPARSAPGRSVTKPLVFGIYPGGAAGTVGRSGRSIADDMTAQLNALSELRVPGRPFVLHLYASYSGPGSPSAAMQADSQINAYTAAGFQTELVLAYRPADRDPAVDVPGFVAFVHDAVASFGSNRDFLGVQVTNEANIRNAPNAADGYYPEALDALVRGVVAAKATARVRGFHQVTVGFNWANAAGPTEASFWRRLAGGGAAFRSALDWIGLDIYPGTWGPRASGSNLGAATARTVVDALSTLHRFLVLARIPGDIALHIAENGYPTGPGRTPAMQQTAMRAAIDTVNAHRAVDHITDYRWFDLRDADSSSSSFQDQYGLMSDRYAPKPAFATYRNLIATLGA
jgi:hypothetical protein